MFKNDQNKIAVLLAFVISLFILLRQDYLFDPDSYLHLAMAKYVSIHGFPSKIPYIEVMGSKNFNYLSEKWIFIYILSFFYKLPLNDIITAKIFIATVFTSIVYLVAKILEELKAKPWYALLIFAFPFQVLLKLRPEPLGLLLMLLLVLILLKRISRPAKIFLVSLIILIHSQEHAFFVADIAILAIYYAIYRESAVLLSLLTLLIAPLINPYKSLWLSSLYLDTVPRLYFPSTPLMPTELIKPSVFELGFFILLYVVSFYTLSPLKSQKTKFIFAVTGLSLISMLFLTRMIAYVSVFLTIIMALSLSKSPNRLLASIILPLAIINLLTTIFYPAFMMPGYDEALQLDVLKEIKKDDKVLCQWDLSPYVIYYTDATVVTGGDIYYTWLYSKELYKDYEEVFSGQQKAIKKFNATVVYLDKKRFIALYLRMKKDENFRLLAENERFAAFRV